MALNHRERWVFFVKQLSVSHFLYWEESPVIGTEFLLYTSIALLTRTMMRLCRGSRPAFLSPFIPSAFGGGIEFSLCGEC